MSRSINDSVQLLTETLGNCKTALTEKQVADVDNIKISDVDEKIAEITAGEESQDGVPKYFSVSPTQIANGTYQKTFNITISSEQYKAFNNKHGYSGQFYIFVCGSAQCDTREFPYQNNKEIKATDLTGNNKISIVLFAYNDNNGTYEFVEAFSPDIYNEDF